MRTISCGAPGVECFYIRPALPSDSRNDVIESATKVTDNNGKDLMLYWAAVFLVIAIVAGVLGIGGVAIVSKQIAWVLFVVGLIFAVVTFVLGRRAR